jgi:twitching motility protein PilJ
MGFLQKGKQDDNHLVVPDTEFGPELAALGPDTIAAGAAPTSSGDEDSPLSLGGLMGRKRGPAAVSTDDGDERPLPFIGHLSLARQLRILLIVSVIGILVTVFALWRNSNANAVASAQTQIASDALMHSQRIGKAAPNAIQGTPEAFTQLQQSRVELSNDLVLLTKGGKFAGSEIPSAPSSIGKALRAATEKWSVSDTAAGTILRTQQELVGFEKTLKQLDTLTPELLKMAEELLNQKVARGGTARELASLGRLTMLTQRLSRNASEFLTSGSVRTDTAFQLGGDITTFRVIVDGFLNGNDTMQLGAMRDADMRNKLTEIRAKFDIYNELVRSFLANQQKFGAAKAAERSIYYENEGLRTQLSDLQRTFREGQDSTDIWFWIMVIASIFTLATAGGVSRVMLQDSRNRTRGADVRRQEAEVMRQQSQTQEEEAKATNEQNQAAILRLMNELQEVADGDLTVHATVSEDITGAIADSVNYTVEELRGLVERVTRTAEQVTTASTSAQNISTELLTATQQQSKEIQEASTTVLKMASEINDVSRSANESADVARQSVAAAHQGSTAVENAIKGMHEIREQIQETSKRIKRLGESSQEIGEITELISDITEQTNVLALNAAIQAASAGEAGRGFSVVAEEVQRLAERSAEAAKQIGALVRTIQTDTHDAVAAMEKSTQGVVEGAKLSDAAGAALSDISGVSNRLAELIQGISFATELQATSANGVAQNIQHILSVTEQTQDGTQQTATSIRQLTLLAQELKNSVSRFRVAA